MGSQRMTGLRRMTYSRRKINDFVISDADRWVLTVDGFEGRMGSRWKKR